MSNNYSLYTTTTNVDVNKILSTGTGINIEKGGMGAITEQNKDVNIVEQKIAIIKGDIPREVIKDDAIYYITDDNDRLKKLIIRGKAMELASSSDGDSYYVLPTTGIPLNDLSSGVQASLGRADTAIQELNIGSTTTGNPGTNASVTKTGTASSPVLNFTIPRGNPGTSSYLHTKYSIGSPNSDSEMHNTFAAGDKYIGICVSDSSTAPSTYSSYTWIKFVGDDGISGNSVYLYVKYSVSNPSSDNDIHGTFTSGDKWMGICISNQSTAPSTYSSYSWMKFVGEDGESSYLHIKYSASNPSSDSDIHSNFTSGDKWIGIYVSNSSTAPSTYTSYSWMKFVGEDGSNGNNAYVHIKYSEENPESDSDIHGTFTSGDKYIGICSNNSSTAPSTYSSYTWMKFVGDDGNPGVIFVNASGVAGNGTSGSYLSARWYCSDVNGITTPYGGMMIAMKIPIAGVSTAGVVISINGDNDEDYHPVLYGVSATLTTHYAKDSVMIFIYDSTISATRYLTSNTKTTITGCWRCLADYDSTNTYHLKNNSGTYIVLTDVTRYSLLVQHSPTHLMSISSGNGTSGHVYDTTNEFDPFGMIYYVNASTANYLSAGATISASVLYQQINLSTTYTFNGNIISGKDVYLVAIPQANGRAKLNETPLAQDLPSTNDGKIYILLGHASSTTQMELHPQHPIYYYDGTTIRLWTNQATSAGPAGDNAYVHIKYSQSSPSSDGDIHGTFTTGDKWIGLCSNNSSTAPSTYSSYSWMKFIGEDGTNGTNGTNGTSSYLHIKYSADNPSSDSDMHGSFDSGDKYIGLCVSNSSTAASTYTSYTWVKFVGNDGSNGTNGTNGKDGDNAYVHIKYSQVNPSLDSDIHSNFTSGDKWIGICSNNSSTPPSTYSSYTWMKFIGDDGTNGTNGDSAYLHIKYSTYEPASDSDMHGSFTSGDKYVGVCTSNSSTAPTTYSSYTWMKFIGDSAFEIWKAETGRIGATEGEFFDSLSPQLNNFIYAAYDSTAAALSIGNSVSSIPGVTGATPNSIVLMPNGSPNSTATMMFTVSNTEVNVPLITSGTGQNVFNGYVRGSDGTTPTYQSTKHCKVEVTGYDQVRFLGFVREANNTPNYCAFYNSSDVLVGSTISLGSTNGSGYLKEFILDIPSGATYFRCNYSISVTWVNLEDHIYVDLIDVASSFTYFGNMGIDNYTITNQDKSDIADLVYADLAANTETWTFTLSDNTTVTKDVLIIPSTP